MPHYYYAVLMQVLILACDRFCRSLLSFSTVQMVYSTFTGTKRTQQN